MSEIRANTISDAAGTGPVTLTGQYAAKSWVNFDGTGTVAIREDGNVSSITDNGTGDYTVNFASALASSDYGILATASGATLGAGGVFVTAPADNVPTTSSARINVNTYNAFQDGLYVTFAALL